MMRLVFPGRSRRLSRAEIAIRADRYRPRETHTSASESSRAIVAISPLLTMATSVRVSSNIFIERTPLPGHDARNVDYEQIGKGKWRVPTAYLVIEMFYERDDGLFFKSDQIAALARVEDEMGWCATLIDGELACGDETQVEHDRGA
jgi:hypothetical protein